ncbi:porin family protein [Robiginitalea sediminis]|uniref:hypothetical protein n=1 Tax=Robiginitalea sediminis TaxID=1982593 RepID=UPI00117A8615|nr:hypothetical protein [Robiginitalea sediminis]
MESPENSDCRNSPNYFSSLAARFGMLPILAVLLIGPSLVFGQAEESDPEMTWATFGINKRISEDWRFSYSQLNSYSITESRLNFVQSNLTFNYRINGRWQAQVSYVPTFSIDDDPQNQLVFHRLRGGIRYYTPLGRYFRMYHALNAEHHFTQRSKFSQRYFYRLNFYYRNRDWPWRLRPFIDQRLFWYQGGRDLQYYDTLGNRTERVPPNGLHAYRLQVGFKIYPAKRFNLTFFFMKQKEFNTSLFGSRDINSINPNSGSLRRSFYDFSVFGVSAAYRI